jgi:hypothetical protein
MDSRIARLMTRGRFFYDRSSAADAGVALSKEPRAWHGQPVGQGVALTRTPVGSRKSEFGIRIRSDFRLQTSES